MNLTDDAALCWGPVMMRRVDITAMSSMHRLSRLMIYLIKDSFEENGVSDSTPYKLSVGNRVFTG